MVSTLRTPEERKALLRAKLSGQAPAKLSRSGKPVQVAKSENFVFGIALRAAARQSAGGQLSPLEERLLKSFKIFADTEEIAEYGKIFTETKNMKTSGDTQFFPDAVLRLPDNKPYTKEDLHRDAKELVPEMLALPNNRIIDLAKVSDQQKSGNQPNLNYNEVDGDDREYSNAVNEAGGGVTVYTSSTPPTTTGDAMKYQLCLIRTYSPDQGYDSGGKAEIYFAVSGGIDSGFTEKYYTDEFGSIKDDTINVIPWGRYYVINGAVKANAAAHIECWEADGSGGSFYSALRDALADAAEYCVDAAVDAQEWVDDDGADGVALVALAGILMALMGKLIEWITNDDDFIGRRTLGWTRQALWDLHVKGQADSTKGVPIEYNAGKGGHHWLTLGCRCLGPA